MVSSSVDRRNTVETSWKAVGDTCGQNTIVCDIVETLEESEDFGVQGLSRVERRHLLYADMAVTLDNTADKLLRGGEVSVGSVRECSGIQVVDLEGDGERGVGRNGVEVPGGVELGGGL
jgi:hypothetical protein